MLVAEVSGRLFCCRVTAIKESGKGEILLYIKHLSESNIYWPVFWDTKMHEKEKIYRVCYAGLPLQTLIKDLSLLGHDSSAISQIFYSFFCSKSQNICL